MDSYVYSLIDGRESSISRMSAQLEKKKRVAGILKLFIAKAIDFLSLLLSSSPEYRFV